MSEPSSRMLALLSLLQLRREWSGTVLADRLGVTPRTIRRDVDRLRELGYSVSAVRGSEGGYRLDAGDAVPPLLLDDEQVIALTVALQMVPALGVDVGDAAERALATLRRVMPDRVRRRVDAVEFAAMPTTVDPVDAEILRSMGEATRARELVRFDYVVDDQVSPAGPPRRIEPHGVVGAGSRWYVVGFDLDRDDWRLFRVDRMRPKMRTGVTFTAREVPGGSAGEYVRRHFRGTASGEWACTGEAAVALPASAVAPFVGDGAVESLDDSRCRVRLGAWSWTGVAASMLRFDADLSAVEPPELVEAMRAMAARLSDAAAS
ncbi:helix-turn-helix transcriptional regulator [Rhodococcoides corynebacterioides]|uniref:helix-turn-helix transcriptional regulator n=1 Tax=Rhodococcoides corynebacterioides TaxID=53972 RepID=UPI001C9A73E5|nr:WYL domain-containing protein [Rhodococcus corynebacterioides]MBY6350832.1 WYL domain-containing protein [Rhodococcus corynebacterioides]